MAEHAVIVRFEYGQKSLEPLLELEDILDATISKFDFPG
jgi:hypothetical protein